MRSFWPMLLFIAATCFFFSCKNQDDPGGNILGKEKMKAVLRDVLMAEEFVQNYVIKDSTRKAPEEMIRLYNQIFKVHAINRQQFLESFDYYLSKPYLAKQMFDSLSVQMRRASVTAVKTGQ